MAEISRATLFGKLDPLAYKAIEGATVLCKLRGNPYVELQHWFQQILNTPDSDLHRIVRHFEIDPSVLASDLTASLDRLPRGAASITGGVSAKAAPASTFHSKRRTSYSRSTAKGSRCTPTWIEVPALSASPASTLSTCQS